VGVSHATVARVWKANGLNSHWVRTFEVSNDPRFAEKLADAVGLYCKVRGARTVLDNTLSA